jgi:glutamate 5-kinase
VPGVLDTILAGRTVGTFFPARGRSMSSWKRWIGFTAKAKGAYRLDSGAVVGVVEQQRSLLPVGVTEVTGEFSAGDIVDLVDPQGRVFARGLTNLSSDEMLGLIKRRQATSPSGSAAVAPRHSECVHRDNLTMLE